MKKLMVVMLASGVLFGCGQGEAPRASTPEIKAEVIPPPVVKKHNYSMVDGYEYGYEKALSQNDINKGQVTAPLLMARYNGQRDGKYQVYTKPEDAPGTTLVLECTTPCEFMKTMIFYQGELLSTQRMRAAPGVIGWMMLEDAINGEMERYVGSRDGRPVHLWFDEKKGVSYIPVENSGKQTKS